jgi:hypothetical protein
MIYINKGMHIKNDNALKSYKNINLNIQNNIQILNQLDLSEYDCVYSPVQPINVSQYPNTKFLFGPHFSIFPVKHQIDLITSNNAIYIQPSEWVVKLWKENPICNNIKIMPLSFGVDTEKFNCINNIQERTKVFVYFKRRKHTELNYLLNFLQTKNIEIRLFDYVSHYSEKDYINYLQNSNYGIWLDAHESQGFALEEALSCNVPLLVWNITSLNQEQGSNYPNSPATTIPYWDERCGEYFYNMNEFDDKFNLFL